MTHAEWAALGYGGWVLPIIPHNAPMSPDSAVPPDQRGKVPGDKGPQGWRGLMGWRGNEASAADLARWTAMGAGTGLQSRMFPGCDIDVTDAEAAAAIAELARKRLGPARERVGRAPKLLLPYRLAPSEAPFGKIRTEFMLGGVKMAVEMMANNQQYVVQGVHPGTGREYVWPQGVPRAADLSPIGAERVAAFFGALDELLTVLGATAVTRARTAAGESSAVDLAALRAPDAKTLAAAVAVLPNEGGHDDCWIPGIRAVRAAAMGLLDDDGRELARGWTERWTGSGTGAPIDFDAKWRQQTSPWLIGWPWIELRARGAGWIGGAERDFAGVAVAEGRALAKTLLGDDLTDGEAGTLQEMAFRDWRWVESAERFGSVRDGSVLTAKQFSVRLNWWGPPMSGTKSAAALFLADKRLKTVRSVTYAPGKGFEVTEDGIGLCINTWRPGLWVKRAGVRDADVKVWLDQMGRMFPREEVRRTMILWMAHLVQRPGVKINWAPVLGSKPGAGKDWILLPLKWALGWGNVATIGMTDVEGAFNDWCAGACLVVLNEAHSSTRVLTSERLKPHIAAPPEVLWINSKHEKQRKQPNRHCMLLMTNRRDAVAIEEGDRRYFVVWIEGEKVEGDDAAWRERYEWMNEHGGREAVASWLSEVSLEGFVAGGEAPWTEEKAEMARDTMSEVAAAAMDGIESGEWPDLVNPGDLAARLNAMAGPKGRGFSGRGLAMALKNQGARVIHGGQMLRLPAPGFTGATRVRLLALRNFTEYEAMPPVALGRAYSAGWAKFDGKDFADVKPALTAVTHEDLL